MQTSVDDGQVTTRGKVALGKRWCGLEIVAMTEGNSGVVVIGQGDEALAMPLDKFEGFVAKTRAAIRQSRNTKRGRRAS